MTVHVPHPDYPASERIGFHRSPTILVNGIDAGGLAINWADLIGHKNRFTDPMPRRIEDGLAGNGVATLHGQARCTDTNRIEIDGAGYQAGYFLIATGARPRPLEFPGHEHLIDSTDFLDLPALPSRILFLGGGFISFEFAHIAARAGSRPVIIDRGPRPLKAFYPDLVELLITRGEDAEIGLLRSTTITAVAPAGSGYRVSVEDPAAPRHCRLTWSCTAPAGPPNCPGWSSTRPASRGAHAACTWPGACRAPPTRRSTLPATPPTPPACRSPRSPRLRRQRRRRQHAQQGHDRPRLHRSSDRSVHDSRTHPSRLGRTRRHRPGLDVDVRYRDTSSWYSNYRIGETTAATKVIVDRSSDRTVGAHLLGPEYGELINFFGLAIRLGLTTRQLKSMTAAYPSVGSDLGSML